MNRRRNTVLLSAAATLLAACSPSVSSSSGATNPAPTPSSTPVVPDQVGPQGGHVGELAFAITGDSRPAVADDTANYPTAIVQQIWTAIETESVPFALATGDYVNASSSGIEAAAQLDTYLSARAAFRGIVFPTLGNHECNRHSDSANCGDGNATGHTSNFDAFMAKMLGPLGITNPNYTFRIDANDGTWSAKFVVVSGNSWSDANSTWLDGVLSQATTYTFIVRHQDVTATDAPGVAASAPILAAHPYTLLLCAHQHTFAWDPGNRQVITGNGGAPLDTAIDYGYTVIRRQADGSLLGTNYASATHSVQGTFHVAADGSSVP